MVRVDVFLAGAAVALTVGAHPFDMPTHYKRGNTPDETSKDPTTGIFAPPTCDLDIRDPVSWEASGGKALLEDYLKTSGSSRWLDGLARSVNDDRSPSVDCSTVDTNTCGVPELAEDCEKYDCKGSVNRLLSVCGRQLTAYRFLCPVDGCSCQRGL
jgi:hypothetical protein